MSTGIGKLCGRCEALLSARCVEVPQANQYNIDSSKRDCGGWEHYYAIDDEWDEPVSSVEASLRAQFPHWQFWNHGSEAELRKRAGTGACNFCAQILLAYDWKTEYDTLYSEEGWPSWDLRFLFLKEIILNTTANIIKFIFLLHPTGDLEVPNTAYIALQPQAEPSTLSLRDCGALSLATLSKIRDWIHTCTEDHAYCRRMSIPIRALPTRLLQIRGDHLDPMTRLVETRDLELPGQVQYAALSHCWGLQGPSMKLTADTYDAFVKDIPLASLPRTFREAIMMTKALGLKHLWIDALCIIQQSDDWQHEALRMKDVYAGSTVTLAATASVDGEGGLFTQNYTYGPFEARLGLRGDLKLNGIWKTSLAAHERYGCDRVFIQDAPLNQRAWVLQEQLLARRTVHFTAYDIGWECPSLMQYEQAEVELHGEDSGPNVRSEEYVADRTWPRLVSDYSARNFSVWSDRLIAIGGAAQAYGFRNGLDPSLYIAGIWMTRPEQLLWRTKRRLANVQATSIAPTWSWAAYPGSVSLPTELGHWSIPSCYKVRYVNHHGFKILDARVKPQGLGAFGTAEDAVLLIRACLFEIESIESPESIESDILRLRGPKGTGLSLFSCGELVSDDGVPVGTSKSRLFIIPVSHEMYIDKDDDGETQELKFLFPGSMVVLAISPAPARAGAFTRVACWSVRSSEDRSEQEMDIWECVGSDLDPSLYLKQNEPGVYEIELI